MVSSESITLAANLWSPHVAQASAGLSTSSIAAIGACRYICLCARNDQINDFSINLRAGLGPHHCELLFKLPIREGIKKTQTKS